jgi:hypothetical protein
MVKETIITNVISASEQVNYLKFYITIYEIEQRPH